MRHLLALLAAASAALAAPAQAVHLKELVFTGTIASGIDQTGGVFGPAPAFLTGLQATGRFVFDIDKMTGVVAFGQTEYQYQTPGFSQLHPGGVTGPFMSATLTVNGITRPVENTAPNPTVGWATQWLTLNDVPANPAADFLAANVGSTRFPSAAAITDEYLQLQVGGVAGGLITGETPGQDFNITVNNLFTVAIFRLNSGFSFSGFDVPNDPSYGNNLRHYAEGTITVGSLLLRDVPAVPEPASWALLAGGLGLGALRFRRSAMR